MRYVVVESDRKFMQRLLRKPDTRLEDLSWLDKHILSKCVDDGLRIQQILHICKPYRDEWGERNFATTEEIVRSVKKLVSKRLLRTISY